MGTQTKRHKKGKTKMNLNNFLNLLSQCRNSYKWVLRKNIIYGIAKNGVGKGKLFTVIEAVYRSTKYRSPESSFESAEKLSIPLNLVINILDNRNRGYCQVLRGKLYRAINYGKS